MCSLNLTWQKLWQKSQKLIQVLTKIISYMNVNMTLYQQYYRSVRAVFLPLTGIKVRIYREVPVFYLTIIGVYQQRLGTATGLVSRTGNVFNILLCFYYSTIYRQSLIRLICQHVRYKFDHGCNIKVPISWFWSCISRKFRVF